MVSILDIPDFRNQAVKMPVSRYHRLIELGELDQNTELLSGYLIRKMSKSPLHRFVVNELLKILGESIDSSRFFVMVEGPLTFHDSEPEPDLAIVSGRNRDFREAHPETASLVIEVAISSVKIDQGKASIYAEADVDEYWIVRPEDKQIDVYRHPAAGQYKEVTTVAADDELISSQFDSLKVKLADILS